MVIRKDTKKVIVHCSATTEDMDIGVNEIRRWHVKERGFSDIGYHYIIRRNRKIEEGRHIEFIGAHCLGQNRDSIGVCLIGGSHRLEDGTTVPKFNFTYDQIEALKELVKTIKDKFSSVSKIYGHNNFAKKKCPTFDVPMFFQTGEIYKYEGTI